MVLVAGPKVPVTSIEAMLARAKTQAGADTFASSGIGTALHIAGEMLNQQAKVSIQHVPYKGAVPMLTDIIGGNVDYGYFMVPSVLGFLKEGKVKPLGTTSKTNCEILNGIPAMSASKALPNYDFGVWTGIFAPKGVADTVVTRLNTEINAVMREPQVIKMLDQACIGQSGGTPADFAKLVLTDAQKMRQIATPEIGAVR